MKEKVGEVFSIARDNQRVTGCTISKSVHSGTNDIIIFSLARDTDISAEIYPYYKLLVVADGNMEVYGTDGFSKMLRIGECIVTLTDTPIGMRTSEGAVYTEISIRRNDSMNEAIKAGEVFPPVRMELPSAQIFRRPHYPWMMAVVQRRSFCQLSKT